MKQNIHILNPKRDADHGWKRHNDYGFTRHDSVVPLLLAELQAALSFYPMAFVKQANPGSGYTLVALLGLYPQENLYVNHQGLWHAGYVPSACRCYPFLLQRVSVNNATHAVLAFDRDSALYRENPDQRQGEERFFDPRGSLQPLVQHVVAFLQECAANKEVTQTAVNALVSADLLEPWPLQIQNPDPQRPLLDGLHRINQNTLNRLDGGALKTLCNAGALPIVYAQLFSMLQIRILQALSQNKQATAPEPAGLELDLEKLFGGKDDLFKFNF